MEMGCCGLLGRFQYASSRVVREGLITMAREVLQLMVGGAAGVGGGAQHDAEERPGAAAGAC
jgi:hypothetical protein